MPPLILFDWGDTLMVDTPGQPGKMCDWQEVEAVEGAIQTLEALSSRAQLYVATGAQESTVDDIKNALARVELAHYFTGFFCQANLGIGKGSARFFGAILQQLNVVPGQVAMVGDSLERDILPALEAGITPIWLKAGNEVETPAGIARISSLVELITLEL